VRRAGFTLIEVMVSIVVTGLVVSLAYAATQAGFDTESRLIQHRAGSEREVAVRALLTDALRHQVDGVRGGEAVFALVDRSAVDGSSADSLHLVTRGIVAPLGTSRVWSLSAWRTGDTLQVEAHAVGADASAPPLHARLGGVRAFDVEALGRGLASSWRGDWPDDDVSPDAVALTLAHAEGAPTRIVVRRGLERAP
jgi:prepilin-type N-terminal cleavage/methylation domain-containing protein